MTTEKTPGQIAYCGFWGDRADPSDLRIVDAATRWNNSYKAVADHVSAPLIERIAELEAEVKKLSSPE